MAAGSAAASLVSELAADSGFDTFWAGLNKELSFLHLEVRRVSYLPAPGAPAVRYVGLANKARGFPPSRTAPFLASLRACAALTRRPGAGG